MEDSGMPINDRSQEAEAFLEALDRTAPDVVSTCEGWTTHEVTAHMVANCVEVSRHLEPYLEGRDVPPTRTWEEREASYRAMEDHRLRRLLEGEEAKMRRLIDQVLEREPDAAIPWTGRQMVVEKFVPHMRNEFAVHRWDFVGDDDVSVSALSQKELTEHAVTVLGKLLLGRGMERDPDPEHDFHVRLRVDGSQDVRLFVESGRSGLELASADDSEPSVELDADARTLVLWGRRPDRRGRFRSTLGMRALGRLQALLSGY